MNCNHQFRFSGTYLLIGVIQLEECLQLATTPTITDPEQPNDKEDFQGVVKFEGVSFRYPEANEDVLHHINFTAQPGKTTAIIGSTGSGKSTIVNLVPRMFDVTEGRITIDGVDIREMSLHKLRELIGFVPQKGILFSGDIESNIKFGNVDGISDEQMMSLVPSLDDEYYELASIVNKHIKEYQEKFKPLVEQEVKNLIQQGQFQEASNIMNQYFQKKYVKH